MAVLTNDEKLWLRQKVAAIAAKNDVPVAWLKSEIDSAMQSIEDWYELTATKASISAAIDAGTAFGFTNAQKNFLLKFWLEQKATRS